MSDFSLELLYQAVETHIDQAIPGLVCVRTMPYMADHIDLPAAVIELVELEPGRDPGTGGDGAGCAFGGSLHRWR